MTELSPLDQRNTEERLAWARSAVRGLILVLGPEVLDSEIRIETLPDPLALILTLTLKQPITKASHQPLRTYFRCWAKIGDCHVPRMLINDHQVRAEILTKHLLDNRRYHKMRFKDDEATPEGGSG